MWRSVNFVPQSPLKNARMHPIRRTLHKGWFASNGSWLYSGFTAAHRRQQITSARVLRGDVHLSRLEETGDGPVSLNLPRKPAHADPVPHTAREAWANCRNGAFGQLSLKVTPGNVLSLLTHV